MAAPRRRQRPESHLYSLCIVQAVELPFHLLHSFYGTMRWFRYWNPQLRCGSQFGARPAL